MERQVLRMRLERQVAGMRINKPDENVLEANGIKDNYCRHAKNAGMEERFGDSLKKSIGREAGGADITVQKDGSQRKTIQNSMVQGGIMQDGIAQSSIVPDSSVKNIEIGALSMKQGLEGKEVPVRNISYSECDGIKINILEGYAMKAKLERTEAETSAAGETETKGIYVEMKNDDGEVKAYLFEIPGIDEIKEDMMEQLAYEAGL